MKINLFTLINNFPSLVLVTLVSTFSKKDNPFPKYEIPFSSINRFRTSSYKGEKLKYKSSFATQPNGSRNVY